MLNVTSFEVDELFTGQGTSLVVGRIAEARKVWVDGLVQRSRRSPSCTLRQHPSLPQILLQFRIFDLFAIVEDGSDL